MGSASIPMVCKACGGRVGGFAQTGTVSGWRAVDAWVDPDGSVRVDVGGTIETEGDDFEATGFSCGCGEEGRRIEDIAVPRYGYDSWGRVLDEDGEPHGPMTFLGPDQLRLDLAR